MKGIVLEIRDGKAAVLTEDGSVITTEQKCRIGETIELKGKRTAFRRSAASRAARFASVAAAAVIAAGAGGGFGLYFFTLQPYSYVTLDVNPSLEYSMNRMDKVISVTAVNEDAGNAASALNESGLRGLTLSEAIDRTLEELKNEGQLEEDDEAVLISVASDDNISAQALNTQLQDSSLFAADSSYDVTVCTTDNSTREQAMENNISTGRYVEAGFGNASGESSRSSGSADGTQPESISIEDARDMEVGQLVQHSREQNGTDPEAPSENSSAKPEQSETAGGSSAPSAAGNGKDGTPATDNKDTAGSTSAPDDAKDDTGAASAPGDAEDKAGDTSAQDDAKNDAGDISSSGDMKNDAGDISSSGDMKNDAGDISSSGDMKNDAGDTSSPGDMKNTAGDTSSPGDMKNDAGDTSSPGDMNSSPDASSAPAAPQ